MKRKMKIKEFLTRKKVAAGCVAAAAVIAAGSFSMVMQSSDIPESSNNNQDYNNGCKSTAECADAGSFIPEFRNSELRFGKEHQSEGIQADNQ